MEIKKERKNQYGNRKKKWGVPGQPEWLKNGERRTKRTRQALEMLLRQWLCSDMIVMVSLSKILVC